MVVSEHVRDHNDLVMKNCVRVAKETGRLLGEPFIAMIREKDDDLTSHVLGRGY